MTDKTSSQLQEEAAMAEANAVKTKAEIDKQQLLLSSQKAQLIKLQNAVIEYGQLAATNPSQQQIYANAIIDVNNKIRDLNNSIRSTTNKVNSLFTTFVNQQDEAANLKEQAAAATSIETGKTGTVDNNQPFQSVTQASEIPNIIGAPAAETNEGVVAVNRVTIPSGSSVVPAPTETSQTINTPVDVDGPVPLQEPPSTFITQVTVVDIPQSPQDEGLGIVITPVTEPQVQTAADPQVVNSAPSNVPNIDSIPEADTEEQLNARFSPTDSNGNLNPGWQIDETTGKYVYTSPSITEAKSKTQSAATQNDAINAQLKNDWRVKLTLAPNSTYLYNDPEAPGILAPLKITQGVIFPYTPQISVSYSAAYDPTMLTHSNYKINQYQGSAVDSISISCFFTAQDTTEANYLLAVIHFFRSVTKMFYGKDENPNRGTPPPLCYLTGLGAFQFDNHPLVITNFNYALPDDVDYIRAATNATTMPGVNTSASNVKPNLPSFRRLPSYISPGGASPAPLFKNASGTINPTYVPTKINLQIQALPIVSRNDISNNFSLRKYANGDLLQGSKNKNQGGGFW